MTTETDITALRDNIAAWLTALQIAPDDTTATARLAENRLPELAAGVWPECPHLELLAKWMVWADAVRDHYTDHLTDRTPEEADAFTDATALALTGANTGAAAHPLTNAAGALYTATLFSYGQSPAGEIWCRRYYAHARVWLGSQLAALRQYTSGPARLDQYLKLRAHGAGALLAAAWVEIGTGGVISDDQWEDPMIRGLALRFNDVGAGALDQAMAKRAKDPATARTMEAALIADGADPEAAKVRVITALINDSGVLYSYAEAIAAGNAYPQNIRLWAGGLVTYTRHLISHTTDATD